MNWRRLRSSMGSSPNPLCQLTAASGCTGSARRPSLLPDERGMVRAEPMSTLDAEFNDFGVQLTMLGGHAADRDWQAEAARPRTAPIEKEGAVLCLDLGLMRVTIDHGVDVVGSLEVKLGHNV